MRARLEYGERTHAATNQADGRHFHRVVRGGNPGRRATDHRGSSACRELHPGQPGNKLIARCETTNSNGVDWTYVTDSTTGKTGWSQSSFVTLDVSAVRIC
jgi:hypothetical protein